MKYQIYMSSSTELLNEDQLIDLLTKCRENNKQRGITGMLLYADGSFMQVLEGEENAVTNLYLTIRQDARHRNIINMGDGELKERNFPQWTMGFKSVHKDDLSSLKAFIDPQSKEILDSGKRHAAIHIIKSFIATNRFNM